MSESNQSRRLREAKLEHGPELWAHLEARLAAPAVQPELVVTHRRRRTGIYWAAAALVLLTLGLWPAWQLMKKPPVVALSTNDNATQTLRTEPQAHKRTTQTKEPGTLKKQLAQKAAVQLNENSKSTIPQVALLTTKRTQNQPRVVRVNTHNLPLVHQSGSLQSILPFAESKSHKTSGTRIPLNRFDSSQTVAQFNAPRSVLPPIDSIKVLSPIIGQQDSLKMFLAATAPLLGRDSLKTQVKPATLRKQSLLNKFNRALRWLPGGSAWPNIHFEKADGAVASTEEQGPELVF